MDSSALMAFLLYIVLPAGLLVLWWAIGRATERRHLQSLAAREAALGDFPVFSLKTPVGCVADPTHPPMVVTGEAVIASDGFKTWVFSLRNLVGGESRTFTRLFDRARREAVLRMVEEAKAAGYNAICNVRFDSADIGGNATEASKRNHMNMAACQVAGTAYVRGA